MSIMNSRNAISSGMTSNIEFPEKYNSSLAGQCWRQREISGKLVSILHPRIKEEIVGFALFLLIR